MGLENGLVALSATAIITASSNGFLGVKMAKQPHIAVDDTQIASLVIACGEGGSAAYVKPSYLLIFTKKITSQRKRSFL